MPDATISSQLSSLPPVVKPGTQEIIKRGRVKNPGELVGAHEVLWWADIGSTVERTKAQQWRDGLPPYAVAKEALLGVNGRANINWGLGDQIATDSESPFDNLLESIDNLCTLPTNHGTPQSRIYNETTMAEEFTRMLRGWPRFTPLWLQNARLFVDEGLSFIMFDDDEGWLFDVKGQQHIKFPRRTGADIEQVDIITAQIELLPNKLYDSVINAEAAQKEGWNPDATFEAIKTAVAKNIPANDWQEWEKAWKDRDYILGVTNSTVSVVVGWVREIDGTVSHYIARLDGKGDFLYKREGKFRSMNRLVIPFFYNVGANGDFQSIRGVLAKTFAPGMGLNKVANRMLDMAIHSSTPFLKSPTEDAITEAPLTPLGVYAVLKPGFSFEETKVPPFAQTLLPAMEFLQQIQGVRASSFTNTQQQQKGGRQTAYADSIQAEQTGKASTSGMNLFKSSLTLLYRELARRICKNENYSSAMPGGEYVQDFIQRCLDRGVPEKAIREVDVKRIEANMGIGKGSATERRIVVDSLMQSYYLYDAEGQNLLLNMKTAAYAGSRVAAMISPLKPGLRPPQDVEDANVENNAICSSALLGIPQTIVPLPTQNHEIHIQAVLHQLDLVDQQLTSQQIPLEKGVPQLVALLQHGNQHLAMMDPNNPSRSIFKSELEQFNEVATNGAKRLMASQEKAMREAQHNQPGGAGEPTLGGQGGNGEGQLAPASTLNQAAEAHQKLTDQHLESQAKIATLMAKNAREDATSAAKIAATGGGR